MENFPLRHMNSSQVFVSWEAKNLTSNLRDSRHLGVVSHVFSKRAPPDSSWFTFFGIILQSDTVANLK